MGSPGNKSTENTAGHTERHLPWLPGTHTVGDMADVMRPRKNSFRSWADTFKKGGEAEFVFHLTQVVHNLQIRDVST